MVEEWAERIQCFLQLKKDKTARWHFWHRARFVTGF
jgi:hypothetical protein